MVYCEPSNVIALRGVAQLVACLVWDQEAPSSSLGTPTVSGEVLMIDAVPVAQWIEHQPSKLRVTGSSPVGRTNGTPCFFSMVIVAQLVRAPGCGPGGRGFESPHSPMFFGPID